MAMTVLKEHARWGNAAMCNSLENANVFINGRKENG
jgi:hypothetical protein